MITEPLPISLFVKKKTREREVLNITQEWRVEPSVIDAIIIKHFEDLGIFSVEPYLSDVCFRKLMAILQESPEIYKQLRKADEIEAKKRRDRHSD